MPRFPAVLDVACLELLRAVALPGQLARDDHETPLRAGLHDPAHGRVARPTEVPSPLEGVRELLRHYLRIQGRGTHFLDLVLWVAELELPVHRLGEALD